MYNRRSASVLIEELEMYNAPTLKSSSMYGRMAFSSSSDNFSLNRYGLSSFFVARSSSLATLIDSPTSVLKTNRLPPVASMMLSFDKDFICRSAAAIILCSSSCFDALIAPRFNTAISSGLRIHHLLCFVHYATRLMKDARVRGSVPHVGLPAKLVDRGGHGKWVVDAGQGRDHGKVRQGVHQGVEAGQGTDP